MLGLAVRVENRASEVAQTLERACVRIVGHAAASIRKRAIESIEPSDDPSPPGTPPHTRAKVSRKTGKARKGQLQRAIVYDHDKAANVAVVGPRASVVGRSGSAHEHGGAYLGQEYPERAFMAPALEATEEKFADDFQGSLGSS